MEVMTSDKIRLTADLPIAEANALKELAALPSSGFCQMS